MFCHSKTPEAMASGVFFLTSHRLFVQQAVEQLAPARFGRGRMRGLFARLIDGLLHKQILRADRVGNRRLFAVGAVRLQHACLDRVVLHGVENVHQPRAYLGAVDRAGDLDAALGVARHHVGRGNVYLLFRAAAEHKDA